MRMYLALLIGVLACKPKPVPETPPDSTTPDTMLTIDSIGGPSPDSADYVDQDTSEITGDDTVMTPHDSALIRSRPRAASRGGLPVGATQYPPDRWCTPNINATSGNAAPNVVGGAVRKASDCGVSLLIIPPRRLFTANGQNQGPFVKSKYFAMIDQYAQVLTPAFVNQYGPAGNRTIIGFQVFDDHKCPFCWGSYGTIVPSETVAELTRYARQKLPSSLPLTLRIEPSLLADYRGWKVGDFDASSEQWTKKKRPPRMPITGSVTQQKAWYAYQDSIARVVTKNPWHIRQVSIGDIYPPDGPPITVQELRDYMLTALTYKPENNCANVSWMWENFFLNGGYPAAWFDISAKGKTMPWKSCKGSPVGSGDTAATPVEATDTVSDHGRKPNRHK